ncbi:MAG: hypothetical protein RL434_1368 [Pseudomonadota bacterium]|jgi:serine/threonine protein phosphatase PrpC
MNALHQRSAQSPFTWKSASVTHAGKVRTVNEDAVCDRPDAGLWAVADGLGGHSAGDLASQTVIDALQRLKPYAELSVMVEFMEHGLLEANQRLLQISGERQQVIGSTVVALAIVDRYAAFLWVGDSRLYRYRGGVLRQMTTDHSQQQRFIEEGVMSREEAQAHPHGHLLTRAVGAHEDLRVDLDVCLLRGGDTFLLCSDGLDKHVSQDEIAVHLARGDAAAGVNSLLELVLSRGASDNVTMCAVNIR